MRIDSLDNRFKLGSGLNIIAETNPTALYIAELLPQFQKWVTFRGIGSGHPFHAQAFLFFVMKQALTCEGVRHEW